MKLSLAMIVRDAEATLQECLESILPYVDEAVIGFGGKSSDRTEEIVEKLMERSAKGEIAAKILALPVDWHDHFADARNEVWQHLTGDVAVWLDADDILLNGNRLRGLIEANPQSNCFWLPYAYEEDEFGNSTCTLYRERVVRNPAEWHWEGAIHEVLVLDEQVPLATTVVADVIVRHNPKRPREHKRTRNLDILYKELRRTEPEPAQRLLFYLGRENASRGNLKEALLHFDRYISRAETNDEAYQVAVMIANILRANGDTARARAAALRAITFQPTWPDAFFLLGQIAYEAGAYQETIEWIKAGSTKNPPQTGLIVDPRTYNFWPYYYTGLAYGQLGDFEAALVNLHKAAAFAPEDGLVGTIRSLQSARDEQSVLQHFMAIYEHLGRHDEWLKARKLFELAPQAIAHDPRVQAAWQKTSVSTQHVVDPQVMIDFYRNNPGWVPMSEGHIFSPEWAKHPRMAFARKALCGPPKWVLDVGSSDGFVSLPLAQDGYQVLGMDLDPRCVDLANERAHRLELNAAYLVGSVDDLNEQDRFDAAIAFEVIEHLVDPGAFLDKLGQHATKVVITTPHLAWEGGNVREWDKVEPKGHLRIFDLGDIERLIARRGRVVDLYREPFGTSGWVFASYYPGQETTGTVSFVAGATLEPFGPRKLRKEGLGGSETALIRLAEEMAVQNLLPTVYANTDDPGYHDGVRYRPLQALEPLVRQDAVVLWRTPELIDLDWNTDKLILWMHDTDAGDALTEKRAEDLDAIVVLSEWHKQHMLDRYPWLTPAQLVVIGNGVDDARFQTPAEVEREPHRVAYTSSPDRGLDLILEHIWPKVVAEVPDAELHVYYGWNNFGTRDDLKAFRGKVADLVLSTKNVVMHGRVNQDELATELRKASVWLYPAWASVGVPFHETYCISAVEAQKAGAIPVTSDTGALAETVRSGIVIPGTKPPAEQADAYVDNVIRLLTAPEDLMAEMREKVIEAAPALTWEDVAGHWMRSVLNLGMPKLTLVGEHGPELGVILRS